MYAIYGNIYHQYTPNDSIYTIHGSYGYTCNVLVTNLKGISQLPMELIPEGYHMVPPSGGAVGVIWNSQYSISIDGYCWYSKWFSDNFEYPPVSKRNDWTSPHL